MSKTLKQMLLEAGYPESEMFHHDSDMYVYVSPLTTEVIDKWCSERDYRKDWHCPKFKDQITGRPMYDCAFQWYEDPETREERLNKNLKNAIDKWRDSDRDLVCYEQIDKCLGSLGFPVSYIREENGVMDILTIAYLAEDEHIKFVVVEF